jgi:hypothetical protein
MSSRLKRATKDASKGFTIHHNIKGDVVKSDFVRGGLSTQPEFFIYRTPKGENALVVSGIMMHPTEKPSEAALEYAQKTANDFRRIGGTVALVIGGELGYFVSYLYDELSSDGNDVPPVICYDEMVGLQDDLVENRDAIRWVHTPEDLDQAIQPYIDGEDEHIAVFICPHGSETYRFESNYTQNILDRNLNVDSMMPQHMIKSARAVSVLERMGKMHFIDELFGTVEPDHMCIMCTGGPSMDPEFVGSLIAGHPDCTLVAAAQSLEKLNGVGIVPDYAVIADVSDQVAQHALDGTADGLWAEAMTSPKLHEKYGNSAYYYAIKGAHMHYPLWRDLGLWVMRDTPAMATVTEVMVLIATRIGFRKILLVGADYSQPEIGGMCIMPALGNHGERVFTYTHYVHGARYLDTFVARNPQLDLVRYSPRGLPTPHIPGPGNTKPLPRTHREFDPEEWEKLTGERYTEEDSLAKTSRPKLLSLIDRFSVETLMACSGMCNPNHGKKELDSVPQINRHVLTPLGKNEGAKLMREAANRVRARTPRIWMPGERLDK